MQVLSGIDRGFNRVRSKKYNKYLIFQVRRTHVCTTYGNERNYRDPYTTERRKKYKKDTDKRKKLNSRMFNVAHDIGGRACKIDYIRIT